MAARQSRPKKESKTSKSTSAAASWYVALLRGINIGPNKRVPMADLRSLIEDLGYSQVRTLLNSGNVVFTASIESPDEAATKIEKALVKKLGVSSRVTVLSAAELAIVIKDNPLLNIADNPSLLLVSVLTDPRDRVLLKPLEKQDWGKEALAVGKRVAYLWCPDGSLVSHAKESVDHVLRDTVTSRNWATITKLHALIQKHQ